MATVATTAPVLGLGLGLPTAGLAAGVYQQVLRVYEREAMIPPCRFTSVQLQTALTGVDTYGAQYFADFTQAIQAALTSRAAGECSGSARAGGASASGSASASGGASGRGRAAPLGPLTAATSSGVPAPLLVLAALAVALALLGAFTAVARTRSWNAAWSGFVDRLRSR